MQRYIKCTLLSMAMGIISLFVVLALFAVIMAKTGASDILINVTVFLSMIICGYVCGYFNGRLIKQKGIYVGLISGGGIAVLLIILKFAFSPDTLTALTFTKLMILIGFAILGGIVGVNKRAKNNYAKIK